MPGRQRVRWLFRVPRPPPPLRLLKPGHKHAHRVRAAAEFAEESARAALQAGEAAARQHVERKRDWERRMVAGRARRQALEAVEVWTQPANPQG